MYKDEKGHFTNKENDGGPCHHDAGGSGSENKLDTKHGDTKNAPYVVNADGEKFAFDTEREAKAFIDKNQNSFEKLDFINQSFDDDYEEEFNDLDKMIENAKNNGQSAQQALDSVSYDADIEPGTEKFDELKQKVKKEFGLEEAVKNADDDVLDQEFGKDTPERKLMGAVKEAGKPQRSFQDMQALRRMYGTDKSDEELMSKSDEELQEAKDYMNYSLTNLLPDEKAAKLDEENKAFNRGETVWDRKRGFPWKKTKMASGILYEGPKGQRVMEDFEEKNDNTKSDGIPHEPVDMPKYRSEKNRIVIEEGPHKGESYDSEHDYRESVRSEIKQTLSQMTGKDLSDEQVNEIIKRIKELGK